MTVTASEKELDRVNEWTKPPFLRRVRIKGYKSIAFCDVPLQPLTILVGRNGAGKSNFLDALAFLRDVMETNVQDAVKKRGGWSSIVCRSVPCSGIEFEIEVSARVLSTTEVHPAANESTSGSEPNHVDVVATYRLHLAAEGTVQPVIVHESFAMESESERFVGFEASNGTITDWPTHLKPVPAIRSDHPLLGLLGSYPLIVFSDALRFMGFYNFHPDAIRQLQRPSRGGLLESDGRDLAGTIQSLKETSPESLARIRDYLALINEDVKAFDVARYGEYETVSFDLKVSRGAPTLRLDAAGMSDGTLRALAALVAAFQLHLPTGPSVIGIEEPETSLHPAAMRALVDAMDEATARTQVILTTHSAELLAGRDITPGQVLVVRNREGQTCITPVDAASKQIVEKELYTLADLQRMDRLDLDEADVKRQIQISRTNGAGGS